MLKLAPVRLTPPAPMAWSRPAKVDAPVPADWVIDPAVTAAALTLLALVTVRLVRGVATPTGPRVMPPAPALSVSGWAPSIAPAKTMAPPPALVSTVDVPERITGLLNWTLPPVAVTVASRYVPAPAGLPAPVVSVTPLAALTGPSSRIASSPTEAVAKRSKPLIERLSPEATCPVKLTV